MASELDNIGRSIEGAAQAVVADTITYVRQHPDYVRIVQALGEKAIEALKTGL